MFFSNLDSISLCEPIGEGAFGRVYRAVLNGSLSVAVKMPKGKCGHFYSASGQMDCEFSGGSNDKMLSFIIV